MSLKPCKSCANPNDESAKTCPKCGASLKMSLGKKVAIGVGAVIALNVLAKLGNTTVATTASLAPVAARPTVVEPPAPPPVPEASIQMSARELMRAYDGNEVAADQTYKDRLVKVSGTVSKIGKDILEDPYVVLSTGHAFREVQVFFAGDATNILAQLARGSKITIEGRCRGLMMHVLIKDAVLK